MTLEEKVLRLEASIHSLTAGQGALLCVIEQVIKAAHSQGLEMPALEPTFERYRKLLFQQGLEHLEQIDPAHAARIQQVADEHYTQFPLGYD